MIPINSPRSITGRLCTRSMSYGAMTVLQTTQISASFGSIFPVPRTEQDQPHRCQQTRGKSQGRATLQHSRSLYAVSKAAASVPSARGGGQALRAVHEPHQEPVPVRGHPLPRGPELDEGMHRTAPHQRRLQQRPIRAEYAPRPTRGRSPRKVGSGV